MVKFISEYEGQENTKIIAENSYDNKVYDEGDYQVIFIKDEYIKDKTIVIPTFVFINGKYAHEEIKGYWGIGVTGGNNPEEIKSMENQRRMASTSIAELQLACGFPKNSGDTDRCYNKKLVITIKNSLSKSKKDKITGEIVAGTLRSNIIHYKPLPKVDVPVAQPQQQPVQQTQQPVEQAQSDNNPNNAMPWV